MRFLPSGPKPEPRAHQNQTDTAGSSKWSVGLGELAKLAFPIHPHMLRHGCGFKLANDGVDTRALQHFLGHRNIMHTVRYTELRSDRFDGFWKD